MLHLITRLRNSKQNSNWILVLSKLKFKTVTLCMLSLINCYHDLHKIVKLDIFVHHTSFLLLSLTRKLLFCPSISDHMYWWGTITYVKMNIVKKNKPTQLFCYYHNLLFLNILKLKKRGFIHNMDVQVSQERWFANSFYPCLFCFWWNAPVRSDYDKPRSTYSGSVKHEHTSTTPAELQQWNENSHDPNDDRIILINYLSYLWRIWTKNIDMNLQTYTMYCNWLLK